MIIIFSGTVFAYDSYISLIINGRTLVPARYAAERLGATVERSSEIRSVIIKSSGYEANNIPDENFDYENISLIIGGKNITGEMDVAPHGIR